MVGKNIIHLHTWWFGFCLVDPPVTPGTSSPCISLLILVLSIFHFFLPLFFFIPEIHLPLFSSVLVQFNSLEGKIEKLMLTPLFDHIFTLKTILRTAFIPAYFLNRSLPYFLKYFHIFLILLWSHPQILPNLFICLFLVRTQL